MYSEYQKRALVKIIINKLHYLKFRLPQSGEWQSGLTINYNVWGSNPDPGCYIYTSSVVESGLRELKVIVIEKWNI